MGIVFEHDSTTLEQRRKAASIYHQRLFQGKVPVYVDLMDNRVSEMYAAKPTRIYLIDMNGKVVYNPGFGPISFNTKHLAKEIESYLSK